MRRVIVESPFAAPSPEQRARNLAYARAALRDCLLRGEAPLASHLLYTQAGVLDDDLPEERALGIEAGLVWGELADATVVYMDFGVSTGMRMGIDRAHKAGRKVEVRFLPFGWRASLGIEHTAHDPSVATRRDIPPRCVCGRDPQGGAQ